MGFISDVASSIGGAVSSVGESLGGAASDLADFLEENPEIAAILGGQNALETARDPKTALPAAIAAASGNPAAGAAIAGSSALISKTAQATPIDGTRQWWESYSGGPKETRN